MTRVTDSKYLLIKDGGYPFGVRAESTEETELHGPFESEVEAIEFGAGLLAEYEDYENVSVVRIEIPHVRSIVRAQEQSISVMQELEFQRIELSSFNDFDGQLVVNLLRERRELWTGVVMDRAGYVSVPSGEGIGYASAIDLIKLRDIGSNYWNVDTIYITPAEGKKSELEVYVKANFHADEVDYFEDRNAGTVLRVWFD